MTEIERIDLERAVQNRLGPIRNVRELSDETLVGLMAPEADLSVLDTKAAPCGRPIDPRPLHEQVFGLRLW